jgi:hypothetical protein
MTAPLLPQDRYIAELLGLTEDEMRWYKAEVRRRAAEGPQPAIIAGDPGTVAIIIAVANLIIGVGLTVVSALLAPRPPQQRERGELTTRQRQGDTLNSPGAFAPTYGFEAVQDVAPLGDPIPLVYAKREFLNGQWYGGVRINTPLLWSQIWSLGGSQMLRAVFLVGEGSVGAIHPYSFAIGNNTLGAYSFDGNLQRIAIYSVPDGGRMAIGNYLSGSQNDIGAQGQYAADIFQAEINPGNLSPVFCGAYKPSTSTSFGLYSPIANGLGYRINPRIRPLRTLQIRNEEYKADDDAQAIAEAWKYKYCYSSKAGIISTSKGSTPGSIVSLDVGDTFTYMLSSKSDGVFGTTENPAIVVNSLNSDNSVGSMDGQETLIAVGQSVAGRQKQYDSALQEGELYKVGSCLAVLIQRDPVFISEADYSLEALTDASITELLDDPNERGESAFYTFRVVRAGDVGVVGQELVDTRFFDTVGESSIRPAEGPGSAAAAPWQFQTPGLNYSAGEIGRRYYTASAFPQIFRCALGSVSINRETQYFELGIRSTVAMQIQGMCNFADVPNDKKEFTAAGAATAVTLVPGEFNPTNDISGLVDGTYGPMRVYPESTSGQDMRITVVVSGGTITSVTIDDGGAGYAVNDVVVNANLYEPGFWTRFIYLRIDAIDTTVMTPSTVPGYESVNWKAADGLAGESVFDNLANTIFSSGTVTAPEKRYSFFRLALRSDPADSVEFANMGNYVFAVAGARETPSFNFIRFAMNGDASWEVRIEPVSSWEIRNGSFSLIELRSDGSLIGISFAQGNAYLKGRYIQGESFDELFDIQGLRPKQEIGLSWTEGTYGSATDGTYLDRYARAAEFFMYDEISTSCSSAPEHEIAYVNVIQPNPFTPQYDNLCLIGMNVRASREWSQFSQLSAYVTEGKEVERLLGGFGATHLFPEILYDFMLNKRYGLGNEISAEQIDTASFTAAAQFCQDNRFFYDGPKINNTNWRQWAADTAATHCLLLIERGGIFYLEQAIPEKPEIRGLFTAGNCISMNLTMAEAEQRQPISMSVKYRTERYGGNAPSESVDPAYGLFPEPKERIVYHTDWGQGVTESLDISEYCTSEQHALKAARFIIGARRLADHTVKISTTYEALTSSIAPGDFIKVALDYTHYNQFINGAVTGDGQLVSSTALADGSYEVVYWTGDKDAEVTEGTLIVRNGGTTATPTGVVFTVKTSEIITRTYRIDSITPSEDGYEIEAVHSPLLSDGTLQLYAEWNDDSYWVET